MYFSPVGVCGVGGGQKVQKSMACVPDSELSIPRNPTTSKTLLFMGACQSLNHHMTIISLTLPTTPKINK